MDLKDDLNEGDVVSMKATVVRRQEDVVTVRLQDGYASQEAVAHVGAVTLVERKGPAFGTTCACHPDQHAGYQP